MSGPWEDFAPANGADTAGPWNDFAATPSPPKSGGNLAGDAARALKKGVQELPGMVTGIADIPAGLVGMDRPVSKAADRLGSLTGFTPGKWAKQTADGMSDETKAAQAEIDKAWTDPKGTAYDIAKAYATNPRATALNVLGSVPAMLAGGAVARGLGAASTLSAPARTAIGEGVTMGGQQMAEIDPSVDAQRAALAAVPTAVLGGVVGLAGGKLAQRMGLTDFDLAIAGGAKATAPQPSLLRRVPEGMLQEGLLEEAPQSAIETASKNWAEGKDLTEGMARSVTEGALAGAVMGGGVNAVPRAAVAPATSAPNPADGPLSKAMSLAGDLALAPQGAPAPAAATDAEQIAAMGTQGTVVRGYDPRDPGGPTPLSLTPKADANGIDFTPEAVAQRQGAEAIVADLALAQDVAPGQPMQLNQAHAIRKAGAEMGVPVSVLPHPSGRGYTVAATAALNAQTHQVMPQDEAAASLGFDDSPSGRMVGGRNGVKVESRPEAVDVLNNEAARRENVQAERDRRESLGMSNLTPVKELPKAPGEAPQIKGPEQASSTAKTSAGTSAGSVVPAAGQSVRQQTEPLDADFLGATGRNLAPRRSGPGIEQDNVIDVQGRVVEDRALGNGRRLLPGDKPKPSEQKGLAWQAFPSDTGTLGIPRAQMPQIKADSRGALVNFLKARGIKAQQEQVAADSLKPTQAEYSPAKVRKALGYNGGDRSILVSSDGHVLDGHHQWLAKLQADQDVKVTRLDAPIKELIEQVSEFPGATTSAGAPQQTNGGRDGSAARDLRLADERTASAGDVVHDGAAQPDGKRGAESSAGERAGADPEGAASSVREAVPDAAGPGQPTAPVSAKGAPASAGRGARGRAFDANPFRAFLGKHGIHINLASEFAPGQKERRSAMVPGYGPIFRKSGKQFDHLAQAAVEEGFLLEADDRALQDLIGRALRGERIIPQYAEGAAENEMESRIARQREMEEDLGAALEDLSDADLFDLDDSDIPDLDAASNMSLEDSLRALGFTEEEIQDEIANRPRAAQEGAQGDSTHAPVAPGQAQGTAGQGNGSPGFDLPARNNAELSPASDLLGDAPNASQQAAQAERARMAERDKAQRNAAPDAGGFALGMEDARTGREVDPNQQDLLGLDGDQNSQSAATKAQESESTAPISASKTGKAGTRGEIQDLGEKIGGARKDTSTLTGKSSRPRAADDRPAWARRFQISQVVDVQGVSDAGKWMIYDERQKDWLGQPKRLAGPLDSKDEAERALPMLAVAQKHRVVPTGGNDPKFEIWRTVNDKKRVKVIDRVFDTREEAMRYMAENAVSIIEANTTFGEADLPVPEDKQRKGQQRRSGDVSGADFMKTFGFRGVEFGNWNNQAERQTLMNEAFDGLMDLADVMNIPPQAISLDGDLALAFGARGHGLSGARAHYEGDRAVMNLTKMNGAGALAHEWFHALDHYFARVDGKASSSWVTAPNGTRSLPVGADFGMDSVTSGFSVGSRSKARSEIREAFANLMQTIARKAEKYVEDTERVDRFVSSARDDVAGRLGSLRRDLAAQLDTRYYKRHNKPASAEQLAQFDTIAQQIVAGQSLDTELRRVEGAAKSRSLLSGARWTNDALEQLSTIYKNVRGRSGFTSDQSGVLDQLRGHMGRYEQRLKMLSDAQASTEKVRMVPTDFAMDAKSLDQGRGGNYWTEPYEMAARAFQGYVDDKLATQGGKSPFLNHGPENVGIVTPWGWKRPFPAGEERKAINAAFDKLVSSIKTRESEGGGIAMYSRDITPELADALMNLRAPKKATPESVKSAISELVKDGNTLPDGLGHVVVTTAADIKKTWEPLIGPVAMESEEGGQAQGFFDPQTNTVFLIADHIRAGDEIGVVAHELMHKHGPAVLGAAGWDKLHGVIQGWADAPAQSLERRVHDAAMERVNSAAEIDGASTAHTSQELFPYAVQVALEMGVRPNAVGRAGTVARWLAEVIQSLRTVWAKITGNPDSFKTQDLVNLAYGIAQRENPAFSNGITAAMDRQREIESFIDRSLAAQDPSGEFPIWATTTREVADILEQGGPDVTGMVHMLVAHELKHAIKHGAEDEASKHPGQRPLTVDDLKRIPLVLESYDSLTVKKAGPNRTSVLYRKQFEDGRVEYVERVIQTSKKKKPRLVTKTAWVVAPTGVESDPSQVYAPERPTNVAGQEGGVKFSRSADAARSSMGELTPEQARALERVAHMKNPLTVRERFDQLRENLGLKLRQGLVDQFAPIQQLDQKAYIMARMSKGSDGTTEAALLYGKPFLRDGVPDVDVKDGGFARVLADLQGEHDRFLWWVAAQRAERLKAEGKENLMGDQDIQALRSLAVGQMPDGSARAQAYAKALQQLNEFNDSTLKMAQESGLIDQEAFDLMRSQPYVPFYRVMEGEMAGPRFSAGLVNQQAWKKLKGGSQQLNNDLLENMLRNWDHLYAAAARNRAALATMDAAEKMAIAYKVPADTKGSVKVMRDGVTEHWAVEDPYLLEAITALNYAPGGLAKMLSPMKNLLTTAVTMNPTFKIRNLVRDSISAVAQADLSYNPLDNVAKGWKATGRDAQTYASMLASGGVIRFGTKENTNRVRDQIAALGGEMLDHTGWQKLGSQMRSLWSTYEEFGDRLENVNRTALYERLVAKGHSHAEAAFMARDLMDFSMSGRWEAVRFLTQTVPFLNARLQGLYKLGRAAEENPRRFAAVAGAVSLASLGLLAAYGDDDDWKKREDWDRDNFWWFKIGDTAFRIPKPFEVGAIGTVAERTAELMLDKEMTGKRFGQRISDMVFNTFAMDPWPQAVKPLIDVYANKDSFTGRAIEGMGDQRLRPEDRYNERTSEIARVLGALGLPDPVRLAKGEYSALSPKQVDFLMRGYFSWMATVATSVSDAVMRPMMGRGERAEMRLRDTFLVGNFVESLPTGSSRYVTAMYEQARDVEQAYASYQDAIKRGDLEQAKAIQQEEGPKLQNRLALAHAKRQIGEIDNLAKRIEANQLLSAQAKRQRLDELEQRRHAIASRLPAA